MKQLLGKYVCLVIFSLASLGQVTGAPTANEIGKIVDIPTLGRPVMLGELYSAHSDQFIPGFSLWDKDLINDKKRIIWHPSSHVDLSADASREDKLSYLDLGASLSASLDGGLMKISGSAEYLNNKEDDEDTTSVTMSYKSITRTETLSESLTTNTDQTNCNLPLGKNSLPTHIVSSVTFGGNCHFHFQKTVRNNEDKRDISGKLSILITEETEAGPVTIKGSAHLNYNTSSEEFKSDLRIKLYSDFILEKQPLTFNDTLEIYQNISSNFGTKGSKYNESVPMSMVLIPLKLFCKDGGLAAEIAKDILKRATNVRLTLLKVLDKIATLLVSRVAVGNFVVRLLLLDFQSDVANYKINYEAKLQQIIIGARNPNIFELNETALVDLIDSDTSSPYDYATYLYPYLTEKTRQVNAINIFYTQTILQDEPQIAVYSKADIPEAIITEPIVFVLTLFVLPDVDAEKYSVYIKQTSPKDRETLFENLWYNNLATIGEVGTAWRNFRTFFELNEYEDGTHYFVLLKQEETNKNIMNLQLFVAGVETPFQLAELMKLTVKPSVSRAGSIITITVDNPQIPETYIENNNLNNPSKATANVLIMNPQANLLSTIDQVLVIVTKTPSDNLYSSTPTLLKVDIDKTSTSTVITIPDLVPEYSYNVTVAYNTEYGSLTPSKVETKMGEFDEMEKTVGCKIEENKKTTNITIMKNSISAIECANICHSEPNCTDGWTFQLGVGNCYSNDAGSKSTSMEGWAVGTQACGVEIIPSSTPPPTVSTPPPGCPAGWKEYQTKCYKRYVALLNWQQAEIECQKCEGHLASINSKGEDTFITNLVVDDTYVNVGGFKIEKWGLWTDGSTWNYTNWFPGEPSGDGNCMNVYNGNGWNDRSCDDKLQYICEIFVGTKSKNCEDL